MQKLKEILSKNDGSTLVAVVVFAIVLAIGALGYLHVMSNTVGHEVDALNDERAYQTAESGLLIGIGWLQNGDNWENRSTDPELYIFEDLNNMVCTVSLNVTGDVTTLNSTVTSPNLTYRKVLSSTEVKPTLNKYLWLNRIYPLDKNHSWGGGGLQVAEFNGSVHSNTPLYIASTKKGVLRINGTLTVTNNRVDKVNNINYEKNFDFFPYYDGEVLKIDTFHMGDFGGGEDGEKYKFGILHHSMFMSQGTDKSEKLDEYFGTTGDFIHSQPKLIVGDLSGNKYTLDENLSTDSVARLVFLGDEGAVYTRFDPDNDNERIDLPFVKEEINNKILIAQNKLEVLGKISTNTTVTNRPGSGDSIVIIGDITYKGFEESEARGGIGGDINYGVGSAWDENSPILTLFSEGDIYISPNIRRVDNGNVVSSNQSELFVTASLFAAREGHGINLPTNNNSFDATQFSGNTNFRFYNVGSRAIDTWYNVGPQAAGMFTYYFDIRLEDGLKGYGVPDLVTEDGDKPMENGIWAEENFALE